MIGLFAIFKNKSIQGFTNNIDNNRFVERQYVDENLYINSTTLMKFKEDKIFITSDDCVVATDGVIVNSNENSLSTTIANSYFSGSLHQLLAQLRGSFSGIIFDKKNKKICAYTDHFSTKPLFYYQFHDGIIISSEIYAIVSCLKKFNESIKINKIGAYSMLTYGYMYKDYTLVEGIHRIKEGTVLYYSNGNLSFTKYHNFSFDEKHIDFDEAIDKIDFLFKQAVGLQYQKNKKCGYLDVVPMSAGMDCRMTSFVLRKMSNDPIINFTYSETSQYDEVESAKMAKALKNKWIFKSLDNGLDLLSIDRAIKLSDGLIKYDWPAQLIDFLNFMNTGKWGIVHTGVIGDIIIGSFEKDPSYHRKYIIGDGAFSNTLINKLRILLRDSGDTDDYSYEYGMLINRAINGACLGYSRTFRLFVEDLSPFMNVDLADFCFSLPQKYRRNHLIYYEWVKRKYPLAASFKHNGIRIDGNASIKYHGKRYTYKSLPDVVTNKIKRDIIKKGYGMNPLQTWIDSNSKLRNTMNNYFEENYKNVMIDEELKKDIFSLYYNGTAIEKILAISLLGNINNIL